MSAKQDPTGVDNNSQPKVLTVFNNKNNKDLAAHKTGKFSPKSKRTFRNITCFRCHKRGHIMSVCRVKLQHNNVVAVTENVANNETNDVQAVTVQSSVCNVDLHPLFQPYCMEGVLVHPNREQTSINILRDTAALQSLLRSSAVPEDALIHTGDVRWIRGISGEIIDVPLVQVHLKCDLFDSLVEVCLISSLPDEVDFLLGNDLCSQFTPVDECVVTRSMTRNAQQLSNDVTSEPDDGAVQDVHRLFLSRG